jgi:hypothetical protein
MAVGISSYLANAWLDALGNASSFSVTTAYIKLHIGDPGAAGTSNPATETTRKAVSFSAATGGTLTNDTAITWTSLAGSQDATHWSLWDASTSGNFLGSGTITANGYTAGDNYEIAIGDIDLALTIAS